MSENISTETSGKRTATQKIIVEREFVGDRELIDAFLPVIMDDLIRQNARTFDETERSA